MKVYILIFKFIVLYLPDEVIQKCLSALHVTKLNLTQTMMQCTRYATCARVKLSLNGVLELTRLRTADVDLYCLLYLRIFGTQCRSGASKTF